MPWPATARWGHNKLALNHDLSTSPLVKLAISKPDVFQSTHSSRTRCTGAGVHLHGAKGESLVTNTRNLITILIWQVTVGIDETNGHQGLGFDPSTIFPAGRSITPMNNARVLIAVQCPASIPAGDTITFTFQLPGYIKDPQAVQHSATRTCIGIFVVSCLLHGYSRVDVRRPVYAQVWRV